MSQRNFILHHGVEPEQAPCGSDSAECERQDDSSITREPQRGPLELLGQMSDAALCKAAGGALFLASFFVGR
jgi:hypothetical protein